MSDAEPTPRAAIAPAVVLVRPREEGNVGMVARAMANMGLDELILVEPAPALGGAARGFGVGGWHVLDGCRRAPDLDAALAPFHRAIGTTADRGRRRSDAPIDARALGDRRRADPSDARWALVFGPEDTGLTRDELARCHPLVRIDCSPEHPTLNLAQAVLLVAYELRRDASAATAQTARPRPGDDLVPRQEITGLVDQLARLIDALGYDQPHLRRSVLADLRRLAGRITAGGHEVRLLRRLCARALHRLGAADGSR